VPCAVKNGQRHDDMQTFLGRRGKGKAVTCPACQGEEQKKKEGLTPGHGDVRLRPAPTSSGPFGEKKKGEEKKRTFSLFFPGGGGGKRGGLLDRGRAAAMLSKVHRDTKRDRKKKKRKTAPFRILPAPGKEEDRTSRSRCSRSAPREKKEKRNPSLCCGQEKKKKKGSTSVWPPSIKKKKKRSPRCPSIASLCQKRDGWRYRRQKRRSTSMESPTKKEKKRKNPLGRIYPASMADEGHEKGKNPG